MYRSSEVERMTVNHRVAGSNPADTATGPVTGEEITKEKWMRNHVNVPSYFDELVRRIAESERKVK